MHKNGDIWQLVLGTESKLLTVEIESVSDRLAGIAHKIILKDIGVFESSDNDGIDAMLETENSFFSRLTRVESSLPLVFVFAVLSVVILVSLYRFGIPALANGAAKVTPSSVLTLMDASSMQVVDRVFFSKSELPEKRRDEIRVLFDELIEQSGPQKLPFRLLFRDGGELGANAIALPGGTVIITDQLIKLSKSDDEISGVLGHEIGHGELRHSLRQIYRVLGIGFMISVIGGDSGQLVEDVVAQAVALGNLSYTRNFEIESDHRSAELMVGMGRDPFAFIELLKRMKKEKDDKNDKKETNWYSTHPSTFDRMANVKKFVDSLSPR
ncbi:MAG: M48 family metallopeptidase [Hyphomicrobiales bacterium]|nr:M48 family metallopeptidase [Hyphomicrobiales bacterium]